ncbi:MBOAT, membrane-bound O-acyltransferase family-domain-containing protein [Glomus cerebriforme]|uniref:Lysophospholipid acyltransferase 5 n=1 Tax=Glomus cerebriforme TaxID=658196 RepID=A0A397TMX6_9GLOM|nr:MBOAT, membrane-bound O-acyltransferase family-domain-containing protein [Glomus cerebriforme]
MVVSKLNAATGIPEQNLRLTLSILFAYVIALVYRIALLRPLKTKWAPFIRNLYVVVTGLSISFFFNGSDIKHSLITTNVTWFLCYFGDLIGNRKLACVLSFIFNFSYLLVGYYVTATDEYDIDWTMPQCVLCLRMIGFSMDFMDGAKVLKSSAPVNAEKKTDENNKINTHSGALPTRPIQPISFEKNIQLPTLPPLIETIGYAYFFGAFLIGPQFSFHLYRKFITMTLYADANNIPTGSYRYALKSFLLGALYLGVQQIAVGFFPMSYLLTKEYAAKPFINRLAYMWMAAKFSFTKYLGIWTLAEGSCILSGISFNGYGASGNPEWNGLANVEKMKFEFATSLNQIVGAFNTNTNLWTKIYIFKRLIFLGNKNLSSLGALLFLALWHGVHPGYYLCFSLEYVDIETEKRWVKRLEPYIKPLYDPKNASDSTITILRRLYEFACWFGQTCGLHYAMVPFELLKWNKIVIAYNSVYWIGHIVVFTLLFIDMILPKRRTKKADKATITLDEKVNNDTYINGTTKVKKQ